MSSNIFYDVDVDTMFYIRYISPLATPAST